ncbi:adaptor protein MecA [Streptococcus pacificus]|uniref:Adapter protein MecA n=1 Tax=Streptococcus pacificus TaxID=2740577 RepID=A0ABS0ZIF9_9STRE|nr:adaptor protein MecA [Streptococcus pacificus]MBJ8325792.1 adaptor protein MecA [Streptococcus pacificus]
MEMKQISDTTLKITISMDDLEERGMELKDFLVPQEKTEEFFYAVMDELDLPDNFKDSGMLSFRVTPRQDRIDVFVTKSEISKDLSLEDLAELEDIAKMSPEEFFKSLETTMREKGDKEALDKLKEAEEQDEQEQEKSHIVSDYIHYVLDFDNLKDVVLFSRTADYEIEASELFKESDTYHLTILIKNIGRPDYYTNVVYARMIEHAKASTKTRAYLQEHGILLTSNAIEELQSIEV